MPKEHTRTNPLIVIKSTTNLAPEEQVREIIEALQRQVTHDFKPAWGLGATIVYDDGEDYTDAYRINIRREAKKEDEGFLGYHFSDGGYPVATLFAETDLTVDKGISDTLSHEVLEMLVDPACNLYAHRPRKGDRPARGYFFEVCDAVQSQKYEIDGHKVCDFVYPEWFEHMWEPGKRKFDHLGKLNEPFELLADCYMDVYERRPGTRGHFRTIWGPENEKDGESGSKKHRKEHRKNQRINIRTEED
jgi:hypothetical protein